jgi:putative salt-induced outer membrane protein
MSMLRFAPALLALLPLPALAQTALPPAVRAMVEAAAKGGDAAKIDAVVAIAKETNPESGEEIDAIVKQYADAREAQRVEELKTAGFFDKWAGRIDFGGSVSTGTVNNSNLAMGIALKREGLSWNHQAGFSADIQKAEGATIQNRLYGTWQSDWKLTDRFYLLGRFEYEKNFNAGIDRRFVETIGAGYRMVLPPPISWDLEAGPAFRQTRFLDGSSENAVAFRGASRFAWAISDNTNLSNDTFIFIESASSIQNTLAISTSLWRGISAGVSFTYLWEEEPLPGLQSSSTITRFTLGYSF